jgi:hypothetical protein
MWSPAALALALPSPVLAMIRLRFELRQPAEDGQYQPAMGLLVSAHVSVQHRLGRELHFLAIVDEGGQNSLARAGPVLLPPNCEKFGLGLLI